MPKETRHTGTFVAVSEAGQTHTLHLWRDYIRVDSFAKPTEEKAGLYTIRTDDGDHVNWLEKGKYQVVTTGEILHSHDPNAL